MNSSRAESAERALANLLDVLASILIPLDVTPSRLAQIARASFVKTGAAQARMRSSGRPHIARIAALTGLSRAEVKRIVSANFQFGELEQENVPRALRVFRAWRTSNTYSKRGRPLVLKVSGGPVSFQSLCKEFSGDIPHKVILKELERRMLVRLSKKRDRVGIRSTRRRPRDQRQELSTLLFAASFLEELADSERVLVRRTEHIAAPLDISNSYVEKAIANRVTSLVDDLPRLFARKGRKTSKQTGLNVYALVTRERKRRD